MSSEQLNELAQWLAIFFGYLCLDSFSRRQVKCNRALMDAITQLAGTQGKVINLLGKWIEALKRFSDGKP